MDESTDDSWQAENNRKAKNLAGWSIAWLGGTALLAFGPKYMWGLFDVAHTSCGAA